MQKTGLAVVVLVLAGVLAACSASPRKRVEQGLRDLGMDRQPAKCMARNLDERLDKRDMKTLARFLEEAGERGDARPARILETVEQMDDPAITVAAVKAGVSCTVLR